MRFGTSVLAATFAAVFSMGSAAQATPVSLTFNGYESGSQNAYLVIPGPQNDGWYRAGGFSMTGSDGDFVAWCIDLFDSIGRRGASSSYQETDGAGAVTAAGSRVSAGEVSLLNRLFTGYSDQALQNSTTSAAFQVAIWEIVEDAGLSLASGGFRAGGNSAVTSLAQSWLSNLGSFGEEYELTFFMEGNRRGYGRQDLVTGVAPVPLPAGAVLLLTGLGAFGIARRRRKAS